MNWIDIVAGPLFGLLSAYLIFQLLSILVFFILVLFAFVTHRAERNSGLALMFAATVNLVLYAALLGFACWLVFGALQYGRIIHNPLFLIFAGLGSLLMIARMPMQFRIFWHTAMVPGFFRDFQRSLDDSKPGRNVFEQQNTALKTIIRLMQQGPGSKSAALNFHIAAGIGKIQANLSRNALADFSKAIKLDNRYAHAYFARAMAHEQLKHYPAALADYSHAIELRPDYPTFYYARGIVKVYSDDLQNAVADYGKALDLGYEPRQSCLARRGLVRCKLADFAGAISDLTEAGELEPDNYEHDYYRALAKSRLEDYSGAIVDITRVIEHLPKEAPPFKSGGYKFNSGDFQGALEDFTKAIELNSKLAGVFGMRGLTRQRLEDFPGALEDHGKGLELNPHDAIAWHSSGETRFALNDFSGAIQDYSKAIELAPKYEYAYRSRAKAKAALGDTQGAESDTRKAADLQKGERPLEDDSIATNIRQQL